MNIKKNIIIASSIVFSVFIVLLSYKNTTYHSKAMETSGIATLAGDCKDGQYYISSKGYCVSCPKGYNHSDGARNMKSNCYLITEPGKFVPYSESEQKSCRIGTYSEGGVKVYYYKTNFCTNCPDGTGTGFKAEQSSKNSCTKTGYDGINRCSWYDMNIKIDQVFEDFCTYKYGTTAELKITNSNPTALSVSAINGDDKTTAAVIYKGLKPGRATVSYTINGKKDTVTINVLCGDGKYLSSDGSSCLTKCPTGEKNDEGVCVKDKTCNDGEYLKDSKCVSCPDYYDHSDGDRKSINNCYLTTNPGRFIPEPGASPSSCPISTYSEENAKIYYGKNNNCTLCPEGTRTSLQGSKSKSECVSDSGKYSKTNFCGEYSYLDLSGYWKGYRGYCVYKYGTNTTLTVTSSNPSVIKVSGHNGSSTKTAYLEYDPISPGASEITYTFNGRTLSYTIYVKCNDGKYLSSDSKSCVTKCNSGEKLDDYKIRCVAETKTTCASDEELVNGKCVKKEQPTTPTIPTTPTCSSDEILVDGKCVKKEQTPTCASDEELVNGKCVKKTPQCSKTEKLVDGKCVKIINKCYHTCDNKYVWGDHDNESCYNVVTSITQEKNCNKSFIEKSETIKCKSDEKVVDGKCVTIVNKCYKTCDNKYVWGYHDREKCYSIVSNVTKKEYCNKEYIERQDEITCDDGEKLVDGKCVDIDFRCYHTCDNDYVWGDYENQDCYTLDDSIKTEKACIEKHLAPKNTNESIPAMIYIIIAAIMIIIAIMISGMLSKKTNPTISKRKTNNNDDDYNDYQDFYK